MKTKHQILLYIFGIALLATSCVNNQRTENTQSIESNSQEPALEIDRDFLEAYLGGNKLAADKKYKDKRFFVRGMITEVTNLYEPIVKVQTELGSVECVFDKSQIDELANLTPGQRVVIDCIFSGIIMTVRFHNCKIVKVTSNE
ncbi:MAG: hypothetical protein Q7I99_03770 [Acholeplasmataceae bacterium]|nr:hypothetical protein [Acholeplasmataceae bacterium]